MWCPDKTHAEFGLGNRQVKVIKIMDISKFKSFTIFICVAHLIYTIRLRYVTVFLFYR